PSQSADDQRLLEGETDGTLAPQETGTPPEAAPARASPGTNELVSVDSAGNQADGFSTLSAISTDGRFVAFVSAASNLASGDTNGQSDVFVHDRQTGATERVSVDSAGSQADGGSETPAISADGRFVVFVSAASNLVPGDTNGQSEVFVHDRQTGATEQVNVDSAGNQADGSSEAPAISGDGRFVAFVSAASNLVPGDTDGQTEIFVHDRRTGATERVSVDSAGNQGDDGSGAPAISADGRFVAFASTGTNLV
ncbi:unnamed protein product, partial [marine sediment metagenome]